MPCFKTRRISLKQKHNDYTTVKPLLSGDLGERANRPLYRGWPLKQVFQKVIYGSMVKRNYCCFPGLVVREVNKRGISHVLRCTYKRQAKQRNHTYAGYVYIVMFHELLKDTGHGSRIVASKASYCNWLHDRLIEVKYKKLANWEF